MKKTYNLILSTLLLMLISSSGCKKVIDEKINIDPNKPADVPVSLLLSSTQGALGFSLGSDLARFPSLWVQSMAGLANQHLLYDNYQLLESDVNNMWFFNIYGGALENLKLLMDKGVSTKSPHYEGIAKILMANALGVTTDLWGDVPYTQAFKGSEDLTPAYDTQAQIYSTIQSLLTSAKADLAVSFSAFEPGSDDLIYSGDLTKWTEAANSLSARYWLHLSKVPGSNAYTNALTALAGAFTSNASNEMLYFGEASTNASPFFQFFIEGRPGDAGMGKVLIDQLNSTNDPRAAQIAADADATDTIITYVGSAAGTGNGSASNIGPFYGSKSSPVAFITYPEVKFIEAEAKFATSDLAGAATAYNQAVTASLVYFGVTADSTFLATYVAETSGSITLDKIMTQKYVALFSQGYEQFTDWRRTGIPALTLAAQPQTTEIPRRFPYPNSERLYNLANMTAAAGNQGGASLINRVWWDK